MNTLLEILRKSEAFLREQNISEARLDAEHLIAHRLGCSRMEIYLQFDRPMTEDILKDLRKDVLRRSRREPLAYILGNAHFFDLELRVGPGVLIPRPETEELVEKVLTRTNPEAGTILDLCTGSGAIAIALKQRFPKAHVTGVDISEEALSYARKNADHYGIDVEWICRDWRESLLESYDLIVANPPYLRESEWNEAEPEVKDYEPKLALTAEDEGHREIEGMIEQCYKTLTEGGLLALETGISDADRYLDLAKKVGYKTSSAERDLSDRQRFFFAVK